MDGHNPHPPCTCTTHCILSMCTPRAQARLKFSSEPLKETLKQTCSPVNRERHLRSKIQWLTGFCNSHYVSHFAAFFIDMGAKISSVTSFIRFSFFTFCTSGKLGNAWPTKDVAKMRNLVFYDDKKKMVASMWEKYASRYLQSSHSPYCRREQSAARFSLSIARYWPR